LLAIERYDGLFYRVARKYLGEAKNVDVLVMKDDLKLTESKTLLAYAEPEGSQWGQKSFPIKILEEAKGRNEAFLEKKLQRGKYSQVFLSMGKKYAKALPAMSKYDITVVFPATGGLGPKAQALKAWLCGEE